MFFVSIITVLETTHSISLKVPHCLVFVQQPLTVNVFSKFVKMEKIFHCCVVQYLYLKGPTNIKTELDSAQGESAPLFTTLKY